MKKGIHPENYREVLFYDASVQQGWVIRSCAATNKTMVWEDGKEYPLYTLDTSSASHPVYTGKRREVNTEGRASQFKDRFKGFSSTLSNQK
ncbi:type B 50S ribosomal protein L31 [Mannheimia haemolytica]